MPKFSGTRAPVFRLPGPQVRSNSFRSYQAEKDLERSHTAAIIHYWPRRRPKES